MAHVVRRSINHSNGLHDRQLYSAETSRQQQQETARKQKAERKHEANPAALEARAFPLVHVAAEQLLLESKRMQWMAERAEDSCAS